MKKYGYCVLTFVMSMAFTGTTYGEGFDYPGKWVLFGKENEYMFYCPLYYFDNSLTDVYERDPEKLYFNAKPRFFNFVLAGDKSYGTDLDDDADLESMIKRLEELEYSCSEREAYGLSFVDAFKVTKVDEEYIGVFLTLIIEEDEVDCVMFNRFDVEEDQPEAGRHAVLYL